MIYAYLPDSSTLQYHEGNRGKFIMKVDSVSTTNNTNSSNSSNSSDGDGLVISSEEVGLDFFTIHGWFMWSAWGVMGLL
jgi:hypothetical protein